MNETQLLIKSCVWRAVEEQSASDWFTTKEDKELSDEEKERIREIMAEGCMDGAAQQAASTVREQDFVGNWQIVEFADMAGNILRKATVVVQVLDLFFAFEDPAAHSDYWLSVDSMRKTGMQWLKTGCW